MGGVGAKGLGGLALSTGPVQIEASKLHHDSYPHSDRGSPSSAELGQGLGFEI